MDPDKIEKNLKKTAQKDFHIGKLHIKHPTVLAPLAGVTDLPFRLMVKNFGCGLVCSEMVSSNGLVYNSKKTFDLMKSKEEERPFSIQIFGSDPEIMAEAALMAEKAGADILDINFGCSVRKILKSGSGSALMQKPELARKILEKVRLAISIPLTIKMRSGWTQDVSQAKTLSLIAEDCGVDAICLHPRTARQGFGGKAEIRHIKEVKELVKIPVIGNGDITRAEEALRMFKETGCDAVMVGRASLYKPHIFQDIHLMLSGSPAMGRKSQSHFSAVREYIRNMALVYGEEKACRMLRSRLAWLAKGFAESSSFRFSSSKIKSIEEAFSLLEEFEEKQRIDT